MYPKNKTFTKRDLVSLIYEEFGTSTSLIDKILDDLFLSINEILFEDDKLILKNIGTFIVLYKKERVGRNPKTKEEATINARKSISFKQSIYLKKKINNE